MGKAKRSSESSAQGLFRVRKSSKQRLSLKIKVEGAKCPLPLPKTQKATPNVETKDHLNNLDGRDLPDSHKRH